MRHQRAGKKLGRDSAHRRALYANLAGALIENGRIKTIVSHKPIYAFAAGLATSIGAAISMAFSEGLSDTGELTGRGSPAVRGSITGAGTFLGGILHTLPFLLPSYHAAIVTAIVVVGFELVGLAWIRWRFFGTSFVRSLGLVSIAGAVIAVVGALVGAGV